MTAKNSLIISGVSGGIGKAIAQRLAAADWNIIGISRQPELVCDFPVRHIQADFNQAQQLEDVLKAEIRKLDNLSAIVSCAGMGYFASLEEFSVTKMQQMLNVNLLGHMVLTKTCLPLLKRQGWGDVILLGSEAALRGSRKGSLYCAGKFGLRGFAQALREECSASGVRVSLVNPGMVRTGFFDSLAFAPGDDVSHAIEAQDVAEVVLQLLKSRPGTVIDEVNLSPQKKVIRFDK